MLIFVQSDGGGAAFGLFTLFALVFLGALYFVPTIVAATRKHHNTPAVFVLNLLLGWTFIGWVAAMVWSVTATESSRVR